MAAESQEWVESGEVVKNVVAQKEPLVIAPAPDSGTSTVNGSVGTGESVSSVISDTLSEEYSSDSGKGGSDSTITPPDSINGVETLVAATTPWVAYGAYTAYSKSLGSVMPNHAMSYEFEIRQTDVGRLIGRYGNFVNKIKAATGANIIVKRHFLDVGDKDAAVKICAVEGFSNEIENAIKMIRDRFPLKRYPSLTLEQVNPQPVMPVSNISFIPNNRLNLVEGIVNDVCISCVTDLDHIFVQHPSHPTFPAMARLHEDLRTLYGQPNAAPMLARPFNPGVICITKIGSQDWARAEVVSIDEENNLVTAKLVDVGGYVSVPIEDCRQIRVDFVTIPFQSTECRMANIAPVNEKEGWSEEAINFFRIICQGSMLQTDVVGYSSCDGTTLVNLYKLNTHSQKYVHVNEEMVSHNYAKWIDELDQQYYYTENVAAYSNDIDQLSQNFGDWVAISPTMMTALSTDSNVGYVAAPATKETQSISTTATDNVSNSVAGGDTALVNTSVMSWADEMSQQDSEEANSEDLTVKGEDENARRRTPE